MKMKSMARLLGTGMAALGIALGAAPAAAAGDALIAGKCLVCHADGQGGSGRIAQQRKTPEGWLMTVARMQLTHGLQVTDAERREIVKYLADTQGLAPSESAGARYAIERRLNTVEQFESAEFTQMCARCHSGARVLLQRRTASEWEHLIHFHLGQFPTAEYQALGRDRDWFGVALKDIAPMLARTQPFESAAWKQWRARAPQAVAGEWSVSGRMAGRGAFTATMRVAPAAGKDQYTLALAGRWDDGAPLQGEGAAVIYTGYEWRADLQLDGQPMRQVFALDKGVLRGRMFLRDQDEVGADVVAGRVEGGAARVLAVHPAHLRSGEETELRIVGTGLDGAVRLPAGVRTLKVVARTPTEVVLRVRAEAGAQGVHPVAVGKARGASLALYDRIAAVKVVPAFAVARIGGNGTPSPKVEGRFEAEAWAAGRDGKPGTADDYRIGIVPAKWSVAPHDEVAARDEDVRFAGVMQPDTGIFVPGGAGPNPARRMSANNVGNLKVVAEVVQGGERVQGEGHMIVAAQRWNNPPLP
ncbi:quinohemoprotein amine dehydrogenase subunit alpha [Azoarcus olearius]|nr:quinohemoprotein amine dehydrogenase subunit alpha [Azoarcus olearius]ANQ84407.1 quinohemoprotein amine dehydrogenase subunit alpha [Azoarcus olearius]